MNESDKHDEATKTSEPVKVCYTPEHCNFETDGTGVVSCSVCRIKK